MRRWQWVALLPALAGAAAQAQTDRPLWEAGVGAGAGRVADYPGADQSHPRSLALPVFVYRGARLRIDEQGVRNRWFDNPDFAFDIAGSAAFAAHNNDARAGMPGLDTLFGIGPQLVYRGLRDAPGAPTLHLRLRALVSTDFRRIDGRGFAIDPEARWRVALPFARPGSSVSFALRPSWASRDLHRYFYEVTPAQATPERPAYRARSGYLGTELNVGFVQRIDDELSWFAGASAMSLDGAANRASPLLLRGSNVNVGIGVVWMPWRSTTWVAD